jgi:hypothetical protein
MSILSKIKLLFTYGPELEEMVKKARKEQEERISFERMHNLKLCRKHRQESPHSEYAESNCDYCKLLHELIKGTSSADYRSRK